MPVYKDLFGRQTVEDVVRETAPRVDSVLVPAFTNAGLRYPPRQIALIGLKEEKRLELWARDEGRWLFVKDFPVLAASGTTGPKLREGDRQVPEGIYGIEYLNPNSSYHLSMKLDYPNAVDKEHAQLDGRDSLGGDIFIHGNSVSIGCLAVGDEASEELFVLVSKAGKENVTVIVAPRDFRQLGLPTASDKQPSWLPTLYQHIATEMNMFLPAPGS